MLQVFHIVEACHLQSTTTVLTELENDINETAKTLFNESAVTIVISKIKELLHKLLCWVKTMFCKLWKKVSGDSGLKSNVMGVSGSMSFRLQNKGVTERVRNTDRGIINCRKRDRFYCARTYEMHEWNNRYVSALNDMVDKLDAIRIKLPDGSFVNTSADGIAEAIRSKVELFNSGSTPDMKSSDSDYSRYKEEIDQAIERIFNVSSYTYTESIYRRIKPDMMRTTNLNERLVNDMFEILDCEHDDLSYIHQRYQYLIKNIEAAEAALNHVSISRDGDTSGYIKLIQDLALLLQYKVQIINSIELVHTKVISERATEYADILNDFRY